MRLLDIRKDNNQIKYFIIKNKTINNERRK
jgi:hypothetical protein